MGKRLNTFVHVRRSDGSAVAFGPDDDLPDWAVDAIDNPDVWADDVTADVPAEVPEPAGEAGEPAAAVEPVDSDVDEPPRGGPGSGRDAWEAYAEELGVDVDGDMSRDDIIEAVDRQRGDTAEATDG